MRQQAAQVSLSYTDTRCIIMICHNTPSGTNQITTWSTPANITLSGVPSIDAPCWSLVDARLKEIIQGVCTESRAEILELEVMPEHVHLLVEVDPQYGIHRLVRAIKGRSSRLLRQEFAWLRSRIPTLWTNSYFVSTVGGAPLEVVKQYIDHNLSTKKRNSALMPKPTSLPIDIPSMITDYQEGMSIQALSKKYHTHLRRITRELNAADIPLRVAGPQPDVWVGRRHTVAARTRMAVAKRALVKPRTEPTYRQRRQKAFCPTTGLGEKAWTRMQLRKANYTCQITGHRGVKLVVHHLYDVATHPAKRWDEANIVVVTKAIHDAFHYDYMRGSGKPVTPNDWTTFLRQWTCVCGTTHDRDVNAAVNTRLAGVGMTHENHGGVLPGIPAL